MRAPRPTRYAGYSVATAMVVASIAVACSLNPQPIPPGDEPDGQAGGANTPNVGDTADGGSKFSDASTTTLDASIDGAPLPPPPNDGGADASDASDASDDAHD